MVQIYVDADACPVRDECVKVAQRNGVMLYMVSDGGIRPHKDPKIHLVIVAPGADAADQWIASQITRNDIVITSDIKLAARCIKSGAVALKPNGEILTESNIGPVEANRDLMTVLREAGEVTGGPPPFKKQDRSNFSGALEAVVQNVLQKHRG